MVTSDAPINAPNGSRYAMARTAALEMAKTLANDFGELSKAEQLRLLQAIRSQLIAPRRPGCRPKRQITAAHGDWKAGMRGFELYQKHIPGLAKMSHWRRHAATRTLMESIRTRERRAKARSQELAAQQSEGVSARRTEK